MPVRWSSTYVMLDRTEKMKPVCAMSLTLTWHWCFVSLSTLLYMNLVFESLTLQSMQKLTSWGSTMMSGNKWSYSHPFLWCVMCWYVSLVTDCLLSMLTMHSRVSRLIKAQPFSLHCQLSKPCIRLGCLILRVQSMSPFVQPWMQLLKRSVGTMSELQTMMHISWLCVCACWNTIALYWLLLLIVLDPSQKNSHIKRFWGKETHIDALREAERMVSLFSCWEWDAYIGAVQGKTYQIVWRAWSTKFTKEEDW